MARYREKPIHPLVRRLWDRAGISSPKEAALKTQTDINIITKQIDMDRTDAFIEKVEDWAHKMGVSPEVFLEELQDYMRSAERKIG